ncbi:MAG: hypothetical protein RIQ93_2464 [Verrucomicrobiota bacterium]|jgi:membrane protease YdiL (CAAX protease family)
MSDPVTFVAQCIELALAGVGCVLLWRHALSPSARARRGPAVLLEWNARPVEFLALLLFVTLGGFSTALIASALVPVFGLSSDAAMVFNGAAAQIGMLAGLALHRSAARSSPPPRLRAPAVFLTGAATFVMAIPLVIASAKLWEIILRSLGLPADKQDLITLFLRTSSPVLLGAMIGLAVVVAPLTEELIFRGGIFRYFRGRLPRPLAFLLPALIFAALHVQWSTLGNIASFAPLTVLALVFSVAYERTGHLGTVIVAHALFNLNTVALIFAGVSE